MELEEVRLEQLEKDLQGMASRSKEELDSDGNPCSEDSRDH